MINDEKEVSALRKQIIGLIACLAGLCFSGCRDVVLSTSLNDHILFSDKNQTELRRVQSGLSGFSNTL